MSINGISLFEPVCLSGGLVDMRFKEYLVVTTVFELEKGRKKATERSESENLRIYEAVKKNIRKYSDLELNQHYKDTTKSAWGDWCNDVALFFVYRQHLFGVPIPIQDVPLGVRDATKFYLEKKLEAQEEKMKMARQKKNKKKKMSNKKKVRAILFVFGGLINFFIGAC